MGSIFMKNLKTVTFQNISRCLIGAFKNHLGLSRSPSGPEFRDLAAGTPPGPQNPPKKFKIQEKPGNLWFWGRRHEAVAREIRRAVKSQLRRRVGCLFFKATLLHIHCTITSSCTLSVKLLLKRSLEQLTLVSCFTGSTRL